MDKLHPSYTNERDMYDIMENLTEEIKKLRAQVSTLQSEVQVFRGQGCRGRGPEHRPVFLLGRHAI